MLEWLTERSLWWLVSLGLTPSRWPGSACGTVILEVKGRRSGRLRSKLVTWVEHDGDRYLVTMPGEEPQWVKNMRAADGSVALRHGNRRNHVRLQELSQSCNAGARSGSGCIYASSLARRLLRSAMNIDIQTEHVVMRPEWHRMIDEWLGQCARHHPDVIGVDLTLRHGEHRHAGEEVDVVATAGRRSLRAAKQAEVMTVALHDALDALEHELLVHEAVSHRV